MTTEEQLIIAREQMAWAERALVSLERLVSDADDDRRLKSSILSIARSLNVYDNPKLKGLRSDASDHN